MSTGAEFDNFVDLVSRSQLVDDGDLGPVVEDVRKSGTLPPPDQFAQQLVQRNLLTHWQADNLLKGKHKGFILGGYRLLDQLGRGGMSTVYLAEHMLMRRRAAIKVLPRHRVSDRSYLGRFRREAQATAALDHPNIVRVYDIASEGKTHFIAMEFVDGKDLQTIVTEQGPLDYLRAADYISQSAVGLQYAHNAGLIHRDVKPANLLAGKDGIIKVLDLGLAKFDDDSLPSLTLAHEDNVLGTVDYLAPEQAIDSHQVDFRADIYSLGCTFYFLLTGHPPFPKGTLAQRVVKHQREEPPPIRAERPDIPWALEDLCRRMMIKDPAQRIESTQQVAEELVAWMRKQGIVPIAETPLRALPIAGRRYAGGGRSTDTPAASPDGRSDSLSTGASGAPPIARPPLSPAAPPAPPVSYPEEELELVALDEVDTHLTSGASTANAPQLGAKASPPATQVADESLEDQVNILNQELTPLESSSHDSLLSGERIRVERRLQPTEPMATTSWPAWLWWVLGISGLLIVVGLVIAFGQAG